jgi:Flavodoxin domain
MSEERTMRALVVYESMFGNTADVARAVADGLRSEGAEVTATEVHGAAAVDAADFDLLVVGAPTHAFSLSRPATRADAVRQGASAEADIGLREWLATLRPQEGSQHRLAAAFDTRVTKVRRLPMAAANRAARELGNHGYDLILRPTPFLVLDTQGPLAPDELDRARIWGRLVATTARERLRPASSTS